MVCNMMYDTKVERFGTGHKDFGDDAATCSGIARCFLALATEDREDMCSVQEICAVIYLG